MPTNEFPAEKHLVDYKETLHYFNDLASTRFKLLTIVPGFTGVALATLLGSGKTSSSTLIAVGAFGFLVVLGIMFYDVRNTHIYDRMQIRAKNLEAYLGLPWALSQYRRGGPLLSRPPREDLEKLFGIVEIWHDRGLALVYSTCLAAWLHLALWGGRGLWVAHFSTSPTLRFMLGVVTGVGPVILWVALMVQYKRWDTPTDTKDKLTPLAQRLLERAPDDLGFDERSQPATAPNPAAEPGGFAAG